jgi:hypothetical protein
MASEGERLSRAGNYVLGLMSAVDRERAERDLEIDPAFRDAVVQIAERMLVLDFAPQKELSPADQWKAITARIGEMPQMRGRAESRRRLRQARRKRSGEGRTACRPGKRWFVRSRSSPRSRPVTSLLCGFERQKHQAHHARTTTALNGASRDIRRQTKTAGLTPGGLVQNRAAINTGSCCPTCSRGP